MYILLTSGFRTIRHSSKMISPVNSTVLLTEAMFLNLTCTVNAPWTPHLKSSPHALQRRRGGWGSRWHWGWTSSTSWLDPSRRERDVSYRSCSPNIKKQHHNYPGSPIFLFQLWTCFSPPPATRLSMQELLPDWQTSHWVLNEWSTGLQVD